MTVLVWTQPLTEEELVCLWFAERSTLSLDMVAGLLAVPRETVEYIVERARALRDRKVDLDPGSVPLTVWPLDRIPDMPPNSSADGAAWSGPTTTSPRDS